MTTFDWVAVGIVALSTLFAFFRGVIRELVALAAWIGGLVLAVALTPTLAGMLPDMLGQPALRYVIAFTLILVAVLVLGALIAWPLAGIVHAVGLGFVDRFLGSIFGLVRGVVLMLAFVFVAGLTPLPRSAWWQDAALVPPLVAGVYALRPHLPSAIAGRLDYSPHRKSDARRQTTEEQPYSALANGHRGTCRATENTTASDLCPLTSDS